VHRLGPMDARYLQRLCPDSLLERQSTAAQQQQSAASSSVPLSTAPSSVPLSTAPSSLPPAVGDRNIRMSHLAIG
jgi:hypothetical protein